VYSSTLQSAERVAKTQKHLHRSPQVAASGATLAASFPWAEAAETDLPEKICKTVPLKQWDFNLLFPV
jgi:hypothetical protein